MTMKHPPTSMVTIFRNLPYLNFSLPTGVRDMYLICRVLRQRRGTTIRVTKIYHVGLIHRHSGASVIKVGVLFGMMTNIGKVAPWPKRVLSSRAIGVAYLGVQGRLLRAKTIRVHTYHPIISVNVMSGRVQLIHRRIVRRRLLILRKATTFLIVFREGASVRHRVRVWKQNQRKGRHLFPTLSYRLTRLPFFVVHNGLFHRKGHFLMFILVIGFGIRLILTRSPCTTSGLRSHPTIGVLRYKRLRRVISPTIPLTTILRCIHRLFIPLNSYFLRRLGVHVMFPLVEGGFFFNGSPTRRIFVRLNFRTFHLYRAFFVCPSLHNMFLNRLPISAFLTSAKRRDVRKNSVLGVTFWTILRTLSRIEFLCRSEKYTTILFPNQTVMVVMFLVLVTINLTNRTTTTTTASWGTKRRVCFI